MRRKSGERELGEPYQTVELKAPVELHEQEFSLQDRNHDDPHRKGSHSPA